MVPYFLIGVGIPFKYQISIHRHLNSNQTARGLSLSQLNSIEYVLISSVSFGFNGRRHAGLDSFNHCKHKNTMYGSICALDETEIVVVVMGEQQGDYRLLSSVRRVCNGNPISIVVQLSRF